MRKEQHPHFTNLQLKYNILFSCEHREQTSATQAVLVALKSRMFVSLLLISGREESLVFVTSWFYGGCRPSTGSVVYRQRRITNLCVTNVCITVPTQLASSATRMYLLCLKM